VNYFTKSSLTVLEGGECRRIESTIIGFEEESPVLYRLGSISIEEIEAVIGVLKYKYTKEKHQLLLVCFQNIMHPKLKLFYQNTQDLIF
jgi:hypothetical protein